MAKYSQPTISCDMCGAAFSWIFVDNTDDADIYECEHCNNMRMFRIENEVSE